MKCILFLAIAITSTYGYSQSFEDYYNSGNKKVKLKDYSGAIVDYTKAIELHPQDDDIYCYRGMLKSNLKDYVGAIADFTKAIELNPKNVDAFYYRGVVKQLIKDYHGSIEDCSRVIEINPQYKDIYDQRALAKHSLKDFRGAIVDYTKHIELNPDDGWAYENRGIAEALLPDKTSAIEDYTKSIFLNPQSADLYVNRGILKGMLSDYKGAIADYSKGIELNPKYEEIGRTYFYRGRAKIKLGLKESGCVDLGEAGRLGVEKAYDSIKKYCSQVQIVKTKDGKVIGDRNEFISNCVKGVKNSMVNFNGMEVNSNKYCSCVCDNLIPTLYYEELMNAFEAKNAATALFSQDKNLKILQDCLKDNYEIDGSFKFDQLKNSDLAKEIALQNCIGEFTNDSIFRDLFSKPMAENYCKCAIDKLYSNGYSYADMKSKDFESSSVYNEITIPCMTEVLGKAFPNKLENNYVPKDILGSNSISKVPLLDYYAQGYKVKISIDGITKYYLFDTGASDLVIDSDTERELLLNGSLKKNDYKEKKQYVVANNKVISAQLVNLHNVKIGDYILDNVVAAIVQDGMLLCGKGLLDKFRNWELNKGNKLLILYR